LTRRHPAAASAPIVVLGALIGCWRRLCAYDSVRGTGMSLPDSLSAAC